MADLKGNKGKEPNKKAREKTVQVRLHGGKERSSLTLRRVTSVLTGVSGCREAESWGKGGKGEAHFSCRATEEI